MNEKFDDFKVFRSLISNLPDFPPSDVFDDTENQVFYNLNLFYSCYLRRGKTQKAIMLGKRLQDTKEKAWWNFFIEHSHGFAKDWIEVDKEQISYFAPLNLDRNFLNSLFRPYLPFFTDIDYLEFGIDNLNNLEFKYFYILLSYLVDEFLPRTINPELLIENWEAEVLEDQGQLVKKFIDLAPDNKKELALVKIFDAFKQINTSNNFEAKLSLSYRKVLYGSDFPLDGHIFIPWDKVRFFDGYYFVYHPMFPDGQSGILPKRIEDSASRKVYNKLSTHFKNRLLPIYANCRKGRIKEIVNPQNLSDCILLMESKTLAPTRDNKNNRVSATNKKTLISKNNARSIIKEYKSRFLDFLCDRQLDNYNVVCCIESKVNSNLQLTVEYSFIFTIKETPLYLTLAFENSTDSRCTYLFTIPKREWATACDKINEYFASNEVNKREQLAQKIAKLKLPGNFDYVRVMHSNYYNWTQRIRIG
ncbi:MAG: hypothetical protein HDS21_01820 [Bacteroides sp.]|nr:hypothetical protein [Bacteroides sp.]